MSYHVLEELESAHLTPRLIRSSCDLISQPFRCVDILRRLVADGVWSTLRASLGNLLHKTKGFVPYLAKEWCKLRFIF